MKRLGLIFVVFLCFSLFFAPNKTSAATEADIVAAKTKVDQLQIALTACENSLKNTKDKSLNCLSISVPLGKAQNELALLTGQGSQQIKTTVNNKKTAEEALIACQKINTGPYACQTEKNAVTSATQVADNANGADKLPPNGTKLNGPSPSGQIADPVKKCEFNLTPGGSEFSLAVCLDEGVAWLITHILLQIAGYILWVTAMLMNYAMKVGILNFSQWAPDTLYPIWIIIRQIVSLFVVFAGLYLGLMYIIGKDEIFEKYIPWVIIFALFVNFSYPITRVAIDISNVVSLNIYASAVGSEALDADIFSEKTPGAIIKNRLGLMGLIEFATAGNTKQAEQSLNNIKSTPVALLAVVFILYATYIFFKISLLLITRTAALVFLIIASPILLVDSVIPKLGDAAMKLRKIFFEQLAVGPIFTIMFALTLKFLEIFQTNGPLSGTSVSSVGGNSAITMFFNLTMMLIMLHIMYKVTKETSGSVGEMASNALGKVGGFAMGAAGGLALGGVGMLARHTIGKKAASLAGGDWMNTQAGKTGVSGFVGRRMMAMTDAVAKSSFDGRNSSYVQAGASRLGMSRGMGTSVKMGYEELEEQRKKNLEKHFSRVGTHKNNVYNEDGSLKHRKGDLDTSEEATKARAEYMKNATGKSIFTSDQERADTKYQLEQANKAKGYDETSRKLEEYKKIEDGEEKRKFFESQNEKIQKKLLEADTNQAYERQDRDELKADRRAQIKATQDSADSTAKFAEALLKAQQKQSDTPETPLPSGYTTSPSGIVIPVSMKQSGASGGASDSQTTSSPQGQTNQQQAPASSTREALSSTGF